ncbi:unnamed protein product [Soboliphyme baturini]|uniref:J domain-containing protein n=1 Tax=Soboliphyme baturini TaxID=241478 RepID=A0A183IWS8_9BILA|nr:unnamed protein product [Soboliphyme baturini]
MPGQQFEYDERGSTFYFFLVSFYTFVLLPLTYYFWPRHGVKDHTNDLRKCHCEPCLRKDAFKKSQEPYKSFKKNVTKLLLFCGWIGLAMLIFKAVNVEVEVNEYDPYMILELDSGASLAEIKKQYRKLSLLHHPDRGGEPKKFVAISKAYQALTDEESRKNYEEYGNPDGPGVLRFGIALPSWLISKEYSLLVLGIYGFVLMILLPTAVGIWWYRSIKYSADQVLMDTTQLYFYMFHKTPLLVVKSICLLKEFFVLVFSSSCNSGLLMILAASFEFCRAHNKEIIERPSDDVEVPALIKELPNLGENKKERPLCYPYSIKARALIYAHLYRMSLPQNTLTKDLNGILRKCILLIQEMIQVYSQLVAFAAAGRISRMPVLDTLDNIIKVSQMLVQASWDSKSPLMQLPHFTEDMLRHCINKKRNIKTCADVARLTNDERRNLLRSLCDREYMDVMNVLSAMPHVDMEVRFEVQDDEDKMTITAGALVTAFVKLIRSSLLDTGGMKTAAKPVAAEDQTVVDSEDAVDNDLEKDVPNHVDTQTKRKVWEKAKKKKGGKAAKNKKKFSTIKFVTVQKSLETRPVDAVQVAVILIFVFDVYADLACEPQDKTGDKSQPPASNDDDMSDDEAASASENSEDNDKGSQEEESSENEFPLDEDIMRKDKILETKSKITHPVHSPFFPEDKYEWWWVYICDRRHRLIVSLPVHVTTLVEEEEIEMKFPAPSKPGIYTYQACLRSDSYLDCDLSKDVKVIMYPRDHSRNLVFSSKCSKHVRSLLIRNGTFLLKRISLIQKFRKTLHTLKKTKKSQIKDFDENIYIDEL